jgi:FMNH2-dependent dimethyl sulfone monooxygenase
MRFGIWTPTPQAIGSDPVMRQAIQDLQSRKAETHVDLSLQYAIETVQRAEAHGFDITLIAERFLGPDLEAWILSTAVAMQTKTIQIMTAVHPGIVSPAVAAKMGASLDRVSGGRFAVNIVNGWSQQEFDLYGNGGWLDDKEKRYRRMEEFITILSALWTDDSIALDGEFYRGQTGSLPTKTYRQPRPPIYAASNSETGQNIVAKLCDFWFASYRPEHGNYEANCATIARDVARMRSVSAGLGRSLGYGASGLVICAASEAEAHERALILEETAKTEVGARVAAKGLGLGLIGTPRQIADRIERYEYETGLDLLMLQFHPMPEMDVFAREVMPLLKHAPRGAADAKRRA